MSEEIKRYEEDFPSAVSPDRDGSLVLYEDHKRIEDQLRVEIERMREFILRLSKQTAGKPDHWSRCGDCESYIEEAKELLAALAGNGGGE